MSIVEGVERTEPKYMKIISGAQTGADGAALDVALKLNIEYGGSVFKGRLAESGVISKKKSRVCHAHQCK